MAGTSSAGPLRVPHARRVGRWPALFPDLPVHRAPSRAGGKRGAFPVPARNGGGTASLQWQGPSPLPQCHTAPWPAGGQSPRPAPDPPVAGASRPPGRALAFRGAWTCRSTGQRRARAGKRDAFPVSARRGESSFTASMAGAIAPATAPRCPMSSRGPKPPASARPPTAGASRPPGRALACHVPGPAGLQGTVARGRGKRGAFPDLTLGGKSSFTAAMAGAIAPATAPRCPMPAGGQSPRPAPDPPLAGASRPPGRALAFCCSRTCRSAGHRPARAGEARCVSCSRPERHPLSGGSG